MEFMIFDILVIPIGWLALFLKYRTKETRQKVLKSEYDGSYSNAAKDMLGSALLILFGILLVAFIIIMVFLSISRNGAILN